MSDSLPGGAKAPVTFVAGQPLTENDLNTLQRELLRLILTHSHGGNDLAVPQGEQITRDGIAKGAVHGSHIAGNVITRGHISHGAIGGSEIAQQQVGQEHLTDSAVVTRAIEKGNVTLEKLSEEVQALLKAPREGATTYGYAVWLDGRIGFPGTAQWFDWLVKPTSPVRVHDLPILRMRDDGGWQPIDVILPPEKLRPHIGTIVLSEPGTVTDEIGTRTQMADSFAGFFKAQGATAAAAVGDRVTDVQADGSTWVLKLDGGQSRTVTDTQLHAALTEIGARGIALSGISSPMAALKRFSGTSGTMRTLKGAAAGPLAATTVPGTRVVSPVNAEVPAPISIIANPIKRVINDPRFRVPIQIDTPASLNIVPTDDLIERNRVAMEVNPQEIGWDVGMQGSAIFHPGIGSNLVFDDGKVPVTFQPDRQPSDRELQMIDRILYNFDITDITPDMLLGVGKTKIYDFLNNPHLLPAGYWTGATRNVRSVTRMRGGMGAVVRVSFSVPYISADYVVHVTPEQRGTAVVGLIPLVMARTTAFVDIAFVTTQNVLNNQVNFNFIIHGELGQS